MRGRAGLAPWPLKPGASLASEPVAKTQRYAVRPSLRSVPKSNGGLNPSYDAVKAVIKQFVVHHDEDTEIYLNGVLAARLTGYTTEYEDVPLSAEAKAALKPGKNTIAVHVKQTSGGQYIDVGIVDVK